MDELDHYGDGSDGDAVLRELETATRFARWIVECIEPHLGARTLEIGSGIGNLSRHLPVRERLTLTDYVPGYRAALQARFASDARIDVRELDLTREEGFGDLSGSYDSVICLNVLEHIEDDGVALGRMARLLAPGGRLVILVPQYSWLMCDMDRMLGHYRRYRRWELAHRLEAAGLELEAMGSLNFLGLVGWLVNNTLMGRTRFGARKLALFDRLVPLMKPLERWLPLPGISLVGVGRKR